MCEATRQSDNAGDTDPASADDGIETDAAVTDADDDDNEADAVNPWADTDPVTDSGASGTSAAHTASACAPLAAAASSSRTASARSGHSDERGGAL